MDKLIQQLIAKHNLNKTEALDAIKMVTDYLKSENPSLQKLIDSVMENDNGKEGE
ncbi:MAG TPA: hypothetical protein VFR58_16725 [Flavisolibacter sp.]|nr:hypothetical protein [Flavisolibacter sp.]HEU4472742.1 hypothetical protein [Flavisolibacter sp.]